MAEVWGIAAASVAGGLISAYGAESAAGTQASAAEQAAGVEAGLGEQALSYQQNMFGTELGYELPYINAGNTALSGLGYATTGTGGELAAANGPEGQNPYLQQGGLTAPFTQADLNTNLAPNYQFMLGQGQGALTNELSTTGGLLSGNFAQGLNTYTQNYAQNAYQQAYNNYNTNQTNIFNRLNSIAGIGANAVGSVVNAGQNSAQSVGNTLEGIGGALGQGITGAGQASAAGTVGATNALSSGLSGGAQTYLLGSLLNQNGGLDSSGNAANPINLGAVTPDYSGTALAPTSLLSLTGSY